MAGVPGTQFSRTTATRPRSAPTDTGRGFLAGIFNDGPIDEARVCQSFPEVQADFGDSAEEAQPFLDSAEAFFEEGGSDLVISRIAGPTGTVEDDDRDNIADAHWATGLARFGRDLGPGQVFTPGQATAVRHGQLLDHAKDRNRTALLDMPSGQTATQLTTAAPATSALDYADIGGMFGNWLTLPQKIAGVDRTIPPSAVVAALCARSDATRDPGEWPIGDEGLLRYCRAAVTTYTDEERTALNAVGVNVFLDDAGGLRLYGFVTADTDTPELANLGHQRLLMGIEAGAHTIGERYVGKRITRDVIRKFHAELEAYLQKLADSGAFYTGVDGSEDGFAVITGPPVNTDATAAADELHADLQVRPANNAQLVIYRSITVPVGLPVAA